MKQFVAVALIGLLVAGCAKKVTVATPASLINTTDRVTQVLESNLADDKKVQIIHDLLDREQNRGQNLTASWKETLTWLTAVVGVVIAVKK